MCRGSALLKSDDPILPVSTVYTLVVVYGLTIELVSQITNNL